MEYMVAAMLLAAMLLAPRVLSTRIYTSKPMAMSRWYGRQR